MAGTGKSTIARTVANNLQKQRRLRASFFFVKGARGLDSVKAFVATLALQIPEMLPDLKPNICDAIESHGNIGQKFLHTHTQWNDLIFQPLSALDNSTLLFLALVFVIDALDEYEGDEVLSETIRLLDQLKKLKMIRVRVLITSRLEGSIRIAFKKPGIMHRERKIHEIPVEQDISLFLESQLSEVGAKQYSQQDWPGKEKSRELVQKSGSFFIYAATVTRFISLSKFPDKRLAEILKVGATN
jgi:hypothetical protein